MRERVEALGGHLLAGPTDEGWNITATLPADADQAGPGDGRGPVRAATPVADAAPRPLRRRGTGVTDAGRVGAVAPAVDGGRVVRVLLVDDQPLARVGLARILDPAPGVHVVGECSDGDEVVAGVDRPSSRRRGDGRPHEARRRRRGDPAPGRRGRRPAAGAGAHDVRRRRDRRRRAGGGRRRLPAQGRPGRGHRAGRPHRGRRWRVARPAGHRPGARPPTARRRCPGRRHGARSTALTDRERAGPGADGAGPVERARSPPSSCIGEGTVKTHVGHVLTKLGLRDRAAAIVFAFDHGLVTPGG